LHLCPTRQLVHQVGEQATRYGIDARAVLPKGYDGLGEYVLGEMIAITTYKALFNTKPKFWSGIAWLLAPEWSAAR